MEFGLGLILSFTDNATSGINNAVNSLGQLTQVAENAGSSLDRMASLSALSIVTDQLGSAFLNAGGTVLSTLGQVISEVNTTGRTLMYAENQLNALYRNSGKTGKEVIGQIQEYAKTSMFEFENLIPAVTSLKSVGIEAFDSITSSMGNSKNNLLDYASALASFAPQMKNAYGTGINAAIGAMREYIAEGNALSLKRGAGLDITGILGEDKGATIEERTRQVADLVEKLGMLEMVDVMKNDPKTKLSNMGDTLFQFAGMVANSGVYEAINGIIDIFADFVSSLSDDKLQTIAKAVGESLASLVKPLEWVAKKVVSLADSFFNLIENNPGIAKFIIMGTAIAGVLLVLVGVALKVTSAFSGISLMLLTMGKSFSSIGGLMKSGILKVMGTLLPLIAVAGLLAFAWKNDLGGIKTTVSNFVSNLTDSFKTAKNAVNGSVSDLTTTLADLRSKDDFFSNLTIGIMKVMTLFKALADVWNDNTLSEDLFLKAKELGILPLIESILDLKYRFEFFKEGFIDGWNEIADNIKNAVSGFVDSVEGTALESLVDNLTEFLDKLASGDTQAWYDFGKSFADFTANALAFWGILKTISGVSKILTPIVSVFQGLSKIKIGGIFGNVAGGIKNIMAVLKGGQGVSAISKFVEAMRGVETLKGGKNLMNISNALKTVFGAVPTIAGGIATLITGIVMGVTGFVKQLTDGFSGFWEVIKWIGIALGVVGAIILGASAWPAVLVGAIIGAVTTLIVLIKDNWESIVQFFKDLGTKISDFFSNLWDSIVETVTTVVDKIKEIWNGIVEALSSVWDTVKNVIQVGIMFIASIIDGAIQILLIPWNFIWENFGGVITEKWEAFKSIISNALTNMKDKITSIWNAISTFFTTAFNNIKTVFSTVWNAIKLIVTNVMTSVSNFISSVWNSIVSFIAPILAHIKAIIATVWNGIKTVIYNILSGIMRVVSTIWNSISSKVSNVVNNIKSFVTTAFNTIKSKITTIGNGIKSAVSTVFNGVKTTISNAIENAKNVVSTGLNAIKGFFNKLKLKLPHIKLPHFSISGKLSLDPPSVPKLSISWYERGGVFNKPSIIGVGENGQEAVMPLEKNIGWIDKLAGMISTSMDRDSSLVPSNTSQFNTTNQGDTNQKYLTNNNNSNTTYEGDTDNSVVFNEGAIQVNVQNASEEEAYRLAKKILELIKRQKELDRMMCYA